MKMEMETLKAKRIHLYEIYAGGVITKEVYLQDMTIFITPTCYAQNSEF